MNQIHETMQTLLDRLTGDGTERGLQLAVYQDGKLVVDAWSGIADARTGEAMQADTLVPIFSVTKGMVATVIHQLVERGLLSYDKPLADVWPEFGVNGKETLTLRHALNHSSGIPNMPEGLNFADLGNWDTMCAAVAQLHPLVEPGSQAQYHAITYGWILGEAARRVDGRTFTQLLHHEICRPLGIEGMYVGIPDAVASRVAWLEDVNNEPAPPPLGPQSVPGWLGPLHDFMNRPDMQRACIPASNGIMNARAMARHYAALLPGGVDGVELLTPERLREATKDQKIKNANGEFSPWALGYSIMEGWDAPDSDLRAFGHNGYGGSIAFAVPSLQLAVGFTKNQFNENNTPEQIFSELKNALEI